MKPSTQCTLAALSRPSPHIKRAAFVAIVWAMITPAASAQQSSIGLGVAYSAPAYRGYDADVLPVPFFAWEGSKFYVRGVDFGYKLSQSDSSALSISSTPLLHRFKSSDSSDLRMKQLDDRDILAVAGIDWSRQGAWGRFGAKAQAELTGTGGFIADVRYSYPLSQGRVVIIPEVGVGYQSKEINQHYYSVSGAEASRSGLASYEPDDAISLYLGVTVVMPLSEKWTASASLRRTVLDDSITESPMVGSNYQDNMAIILSRSF
ncbi:MipA/OmpV family protein [Xanthomonas arboricola]|uniref:MipA/OmpV family protein n=1 Tax=Xanthomonas arboricola TaxID=56448 RepID=UPI001427A4A2|nr:MipA/OmpV family protein [Xanthomonas arboricola]